MKKHHKKLIAPILTTVILVAYYIVYFGFLTSLLEGAWKYAFAFFPLIFSAMTIKVCVERLHEIKKGEEDDLGKY